MLSQQERKQLEGKVQILKKEVVGLKKNLEEIDREKEFFFKKKEDLKKEIADNIKIFKECKGEKEKISKEINLLKTERDAYNTQVKSVIDNIQTLNKQKQKALERFQHRIDPSKIRKKIEEIEHRLETEAYPFEKEKKLMSEIKTLKKKYEEGKDFDECITKLKHFYIAVKELRGKANTVHKQVTKIFQENKSYQDFIDQSRKVGTLRKEQEVSFKRFIDLKNSYLALIKLLNGKSNLLQRIEETLKEDQSKRQIKTEETFKQKVIEKTKEAYDKLRSKKKLTTRDLLALQELNKK